MGNGDNPVSPFLVVFSNLLAQLAEPLAQFLWLVYLSLAAKHGEEPRIVVQFSGWASE